MAGAYVRFTDDALGDLRALHRTDPQVGRRVLKKCLMLERDPNAGEPLLGDLIGYRKLVVGNRDWRIVWRVTTDPAGDAVIDIAEVWAVGARADSEVYAEVSERVSRLPAGGLKHSLTDVVALLGAGSAVEARDEPVTDPVPDWLRDRLVHTAGMHPDAVTALTGAGAADLWDRYMRTGHIDR